jgi:ABC-2 type transport system ATP-binding protein
MALTADHIIVVGRGRVLADAPVAEVVAGGHTSTVRVRSPRSDDLVDVLSRTGVSVTPTGSDTLEVRGRTAAEVGDSAAAAGLPLHELVSVERSLEDAYLQLTADEVEYHSAAFDQQTAGALAPMTEGALR